MTTYSNLDVDAAQELHKQFHAYISALLESRRFDANQTMTYPDIMNSCIITHIAMLENKINDLEARLQKANNVVT